MEAEAHKTALAQAAPAPSGLPSASLRQPMASRKAGHPPAGPGAAAAARQMAPRHRTAVEAPPSLFVRSRAMRAATDATVGHGAQEELEARNKLLGQMMITAVEQQRAERLDLEEQRVRVEVESAS